MRLLLAIGLGLVLQAVTAVPGSAQERTFEARTVERGEPGIEWTMTNGSYEGNPYEIEAHARFTHAESGKTIETGLFYDGDDQWAFRFTAPRPGTWRIRTFSTDSDLAGWTGTLEVAPGEGEGRQGFITNFGSKWGWAGSGEAFVPQYAMGRPVDTYLTEDGRIDTAAIEARIDEFVVEHGFTVMHIEVAGDWFDDGNPDLQVYRVVEELIRRAYEHGGASHIWLWGDRDSGPEAVTGKFSVSRIAATSGIWPLGWDRCRAGRWASASIRRTAGRCRTSSRIGNRISTGSSDSITTWALGSATTRRGSGPPSLARSQGDEPGVEYDRTVIDLDIASEWTSRTGSMIAADLDGDGVRDVVVSQKGEPDRLVAVTTSEETLWSRTPDLWLGEKTENEGLPGLHGPGVQAGDVDGDGETEVLFVNGSGRLVLLDGATGERERSLELPAVDSYHGRWEHAVIADFEDDADVDLLLQASKDVTGEDYLKGTHVAGYSMPDLLADEASAEAIFERHDFHSPGHSVAGVADLDGDGRDEVIGADLVDDDGEKLVSLGLERASRNHIDSYQFGDVDPNRPGLEVAAAKQGGGNEVVLYDAEGIIWRFSRKSGSTDGDKVQIGDYDPARRGMEIYLRGKESNDQWVLDRAGNMIADYQFDEQAPESWTDEGVEAIWDVQWSRDEKVRLAAKERHECGDVAVYDAIDPSREFRQLSATVDRLYVADVTGDWREEVLVLTGDELHVYRNTASNPRPDRPRPWQNRTYRLDRATWNYYSP